MNPINNKAVYLRMGMLLFFLAAAFFCSRFFYQFALVQGESMEPTLHSLQLVLVNRWDKQFVPGEIVVFRKKGIEGVLVKRIAAGPGDTVLIRDGILLINGNVSCSFDGIENAGRAKEIIGLSENMYFVLGDNVNRSIDSRFDEVGDIRHDEILGKVIIKQGGS